MKGQEIYVLGLWVCFGELGICGVYTDKQKLIEAYRFMEGDVNCWPYSNNPRDLVIYRFYENEFAAEMPDWNDGKLYCPNDEYAVSIQELEEDES